MPAVDTLPEGGLQSGELTQLPSGLVSHIAAIGFDVCIFDPDLDPDGQNAQTSLPSFVRRCATPQLPLPQAAHHGCDVKGSLQHFGEFLRWRVHPRVCRGRVLSESTAWSRFGEGGHVSGFGEVLTQELVA